MIGDGSIALQNYKKKMNYANYIAHCIKIARRGEYYVAPNPMVGAVLVRNSDEVIASGGFGIYFNDDIR